MAIGFFSVFFLISLFCISRLAKDTKSLGLQKIRRQTSTLYYPLGKILFLFVVQKRTSFSSSLCPFRKPKSQRDTCHPTAHVTSTRAYYRAHGPFKYADSTK
eukprot:TRINITY_DN19958_c1_g1_i12.p1 TRINITY_DN19958_c1_g1~~TRINITY_DN19958_c1_g1_i12.p1  ORF type:complete len:102 (+),score=9.62 TRINITY_DN19958_c1_g1_i12:961-1266(+)